MTTKFENNTRTILTLVFTLGAAPLLFGVAGCCSDKSKKSSDPVAYDHSAEAGYVVASNTNDGENTSMVGPRGPDGPAGPRGETGAIGATGATGDSFAGPAGEQGPAGAAGRRGDTGATGAQGIVVQGPAGDAGPIGPAGEQGLTGSTGAQGASGTGLAGPAGPAGPTGAQGLAGDTGAQGATLVGPKGPTGYAGTAGAQGTTGVTGDQGRKSVGVVGASGRRGESGVQGPQGEIGAKGAQGSGTTGSVALWNLYRDFRFENNRSDIQTSEMYKVNEIAAYMKANPSMKLGLDGTLDPRGTDTKNQDLSDRRVASIRDALVEAGVPSSRITVGAFGDAQLARDRRVAALFRSGN